MSLVSHLGNSETFANICRNVEMEVDEDKQMFRCREQKAAYDNAFQNLVMYVNDKVIDGGVVLRMTMSR